RITRRSEGFDVVQEQVFQLPSFGEQTRHRAVAEKIRHLEPMADGMQALQRKIVGVVAGFARLACPAHEWRAHTFAALLLLLIELLLRHLLPQETKVAPRRQKPQTDTSAWRE